MPYVDNGGLRLYYTENGTGLPVLWHTGGCGLGHLQAFWRTDLALPPIKRFLATLSAAA
jgi:hypothetical protein